VKIEGANVILTGASRGIGRVMATHLARRGARVALSARSEDSLQEVAKEIQARGGTALAVACDVTAEEDRAELLRRVESELGPIDVLINNAAIESVRAFADMPEKDIADIVDTNLLATLLLTRAVLPSMLERRRGHVVNISSVAGKTMTPWNSVYSATKHALIGWTQSLRVELHGSGVSASVICPGFVLREGLFARWGDERTGKRSGTATTPEKVAAATIRAIEKDVPEIVVSGPVGRIADVAFAVSPSLTATVGRRSPAVKLFRDEAERRRAEGKSLSE
jgi:short-subunit dehydrogenase